MPDRVPILLDTDIGSDIDDALCLAYLLRQPQCELVGITTVTGEPERRAMLADALCRAEGRTDVPIHSGSPFPLLRDQRQPHATQGEVLPRWPHRAAFAPFSAVPFMRETIRSRPGEITLLAVGPLTNLGLLFRLDPEIPSLLRRLVLMGGLFGGGVPGRGWTEWNAGGDPHATAIVYAAPVKEHLSVGLDVTTRCVLDAETGRQRFSGGGLDVAADMAEVWFAKATRITFHDPLAASIIFAPELVQVERGQVCVELLSQRVPGMTLWQPDPAGPHQVAMQVDPDAFCRHYFAVLGT
jgi:purine nucleosidase